MAGESDKKQENDVGEAAADEKSRKNKKKGLLARIWNGVFRLHGDDFEKRLQHISKEEAAVLSRMKRRTVSWRRTARNIIVFSIILELVAVGYAIMTTRTVDLNWKMRALRVLPMFLLPALSSALYSGLVSFTRMCDRKDQKTLERLRAERQAKIDELKERTNYYTTQQLIQRYDPDPAAKAAAATVLASKLGADSGLKVFLGDEPMLNELSTGKSSDVELVQAGGLRRRNQTDARPMESNAPHLSDKEAIPYAGHEASENSRQSQLVVEHRNPTTSNMDGGWIARIAALLVGEDPTQSYALICGNCHMHNGLARKEDFPFITYYCPHCNALNRPKHLEERSSGTGTPELTSPIMTLAEVKLPNNPSASISERGSASSTPLAASSTPLASSSTPLAPSSTPLAASSTPLAAAAKEQDTSDGQLSEVPPS